MKKIVFIAFFILLALNSFSQEFISDTTIVLKDSVKKKSIFKKGHDPAKAALFSAIIPGSGQIYNKKYWKVPIVYAGLAGLGVWVGHNAIQLNGYTEAYRLQVDGDTTTTGSFNGYFTEKQINIKRKEFKKNLDISAIALGVWYILNIIDATVDAHLMGFDVNDDISISFKPEIKIKQNNSLSLENSIYSGLKIQMSIK